MATTSDLATIPPAEGSVLLTEIIQHDEKKPRINTESSEDDHARSEKSEAVGEVVEGEVIQDYGMPPRALVAIFTYPKFRSTRCHVYTCPGTN